MVPVRICFPPVHRLSQPLRRGEREQPTAQPGRQRAGNFLHPRLHELRDSKQLTGIRADFIAHAHEARRARLEVSDTNRVLESHP